MNERQLIDTIAIGFVVIMLGWAYLGLTVWAVQPTFPYGEQGRQMYLVQIIFGLLVLYVRLTMKNKLGR